IFIMKLIIGVFSVWIATWFYHVTATKATATTTTTTATATLTIEELCTEYRDAFSTFDRNKDGFIDVNDVHEFIKFARITDITLEDVYRIQGDKPRTIESLAEVWSYSVTAQNLTFAFNRGLKDVVTVQEFVDFLNNKNRVDSEKTNAGQNEGEGAGKTNDEQKGEKKQEATKPKTVFQNVRSWVSAFVKIEKGSRQGK
ncbi:hypothetical protein LSTR_LSTR000842, partial [Laodelphax striatellus]